MTIQNSKFPSIPSSGPRGKIQNLASKVKSFTFVFLVLIFAFCLLSLNRVFAQTQNNYDVTVSPIFFDLSANPGTTITTKVRVRNNTTSPIPIKLGIQTLSGDLNGNLTLKQTAGDYTLSWIKFDNDAVLTKPLEWTDIPFTVTVPSDAAYGYYWAITFTQDVNSKYAKNGVSLTGAAAVPVLLNVVKEGAKTSGKLVSFVSDAGFYEYPPVKLTTKFENNGNIHIRPRGNIFIKDWLGRTVATLDVNSQQGAVLPNAARLFETSWDDGFITVEPKMEAGQPKLDKNGKTETQLKIRWDKLLDLRIGRYTASELLIISTPQRDIPFQAETSFFVLPWKVVIGTILLALFAGIGFYSTAKKFVLKISRILGLSNKPQLS